MNGETDLQRLLADMEPRLFDHPYSFRTIPSGQSLPLAQEPFAIIREDEGTTIIAPGDGWARISLTIHSSLAAVGLTAAFSAALSDKGIPANVVAAYYHDHLFVPWERRHDAMEALLALSRNRGTPPTD